MRMRRFFKKAIACVAAAATIFTTSAVTYMPERSLAEEVQGGLLGTKISQENGELQIERKSRDREQLMGDAGTWTIFVYMCGSDLESEDSSASDDIREMMNADLGEYLGNGINVVIQTGGSKEWELENIPGDQIARYQLAKAEEESNVRDEKEEENTGEEEGGDEEEEENTGGEEGGNEEEEGNTEEEEGGNEEEEENTGEDVKESGSKNYLKYEEGLPDANMGDGKTLEEFLSWGVDHYPADHMGVILWNHGGGCLGGVCCDEKNDMDRLSLEELDQAFYNVVYDDEKMKGRFEFIGFDACLMGNLETANVLTPYARYMIGSEEIEPGEGWYYTDVLEYLSDTYVSDYNADEYVELMEGFGKTVCDSYIRESGKSTSTLAFYDLSKTDELIKTTNDSFRTLLEECDIEEIAEAAYQADWYNERDTNLVDLLDIFKQLVKENENEKIKKAMEEVEGAIGDNDSGNFVVYFNHGESRLNSYGVSIYFPAVPDKDELEDLAKLCPMPQYFKIIDKRVQAMEKLLEEEEEGEEEEKEEDIFSEDTEDINRVFQEISQKYNSEIFQTNIGKYEELKEGTLGAESIHFDENGYLTVRFKNLDGIAFARGALYMELGDGEEAYLGATEDVLYDEEKHTITDDFRAEWPSVEGIYLPLELSFASEKAYGYSCPVKINDGETVNLRIEHLFGETPQWKVLGTTSEIEHGMAARIINNLEDGDKITPVYNCWTKDGEFEERAGEYAFTYSKDMEITYERLNAGNYFYGLVIYDLYGNEYYTEEVSMVVDENGEIAIDYDHEFSFGDTKNNKPGSGGSSSGGSSSSGGGSSSGGSSSSGGGSSVGTGNPVSTSAADASKFKIEGTENTTLSVADVSNTDQQAINLAVASGKLPGRYSALDLKPVGNYTNGQKVKITVPVEALANVKNCLYVDVYRVQDGELVPVAKAVEVKEGKIVFETDHFTAYVFAEASLEDVDNPADTPENVPEQDVSKEQGVEPLMVKAGAAGRNVKLEWNQLEDASGYVVYGGESGKKMKKLKTITNNSTTSWTKKELDPKEIYVFQVKAYKITEVGAKKVLVSSPKVSCAMPESGYTNAKKIKTTFTKAVLDAGETNQIEAAVKKADEKKKLENSISKLRYISSDKKVATVSKTGKVKAKEKGSCEIYVFAGNGIYRKIRVEVR